jgi:FkbM family methyltransferase
MNALAFWSWAYDVANRQRVPVPFSVVFSPLQFGIRLARKFQGDPVVKVRVGNRVLLMPWSHQLPKILKSCPGYETEIGRLATYLDRADGKLLMIDVGANVGDTIATLPPLHRAHFLCVEGSQLYFDLLQRSYESDVNVTLLFALLTDSTSSTGKAGVHEAGGTAHVAKENGSLTAAPWMTVDEVVERYPAFEKANFLKIDTDGYDLRVLRGATALLQRSKPCLHLEFSPRHWREYGLCEAGDGLEFLSEMGYKDVLIYDNQGYLIGRDDTGNSKFLTVLAEYAMRHPWFYMNLVLFHETRKDAEQFYDSELHSK